MTHFLSPPYAGPTPAQCPRPPAGGRKCPSRPSVAVVERHRCPGVAYDEREAFQQVELYGRVVVGAVADREVLAVAERVVAASRADHDRSFHRRRPHHSTTEM